ncbi:VOC family protein [Clostridium pasteurianum]|uniref:VOC family protein n=1 Tax=Clostridium pasteurianum TaxID=1501 RepID=UPI00325BCAD7
MGKQQKQMHFGFQVDDLLTAVLQAEALGACKAESQFGGNSFVTMFDPEGHPFCLSVK